jgi:hypothetical protein
VVVLRPGLEPVTQSISVVVAAEITHSIPSMTILFSLMTDEKPVPENLTLVPPTTVPNLGAIVVNSGVKALV